MQKTSVTRNRIFLAIGCGLSVSSLIGCVFCCGGMSFLNMRSTASAKDQLAQANRLWDSGKKSDAASEYKAVLNMNLNGVPSDSERATVYRRVIEFEVEQGNLGDAEALVEKALGKKVDIASTSEATNKVIAKVRSGQEAQAKIKQKQQVAKYVKDLKSDSPQVRVKAAESLKKLGQEATLVVPELIEAACFGPLHPFGESAAIALDTVIGLGNTGVDPLKEIVAHDGNPAKKNAALYALREMGPAARDSVPVVASALRDRSEHVADVPPGTPKLASPVRFFAARALAAIEPYDARSIPILVEALSYDSSTRYAAMDCLGKLGPRAKLALPVLRKIEDGMLPYLHERVSASRMKRMLDDDRKFATEAIQRIEANPR